MSFPAIASLPPFANSGSSVVWIDDAIKRALHEAMGHCPPGVGQRCVSAHFVQNRYAQALSAADLEWHRTEYLRRLARGAVLHSLMPLTAQYIQAYQTDGYFPTQKEIFHELRAPALERLRHMHALWTKAVYQGSPVEQFALAHLHEETKLVDEVIETVWEYFSLVRIWDSLVLLMCHLPRSNGTTWLLGE
jgi:hypothetical protein